MPNFLFFLFLWTVPIGAVVFMVAWLPTRRLAHRSRVWRFLLSSIASLAVAPTGLEICGREAILPASCILYEAAFSLTSAVTDLVSFFYIHGAFPVVTLALVIFSCWSYYAERGRNAAS